MLLQPYDSISISLFRLFGAYATFAFYHYPIFRNASLHQFILDIACTLLGETVICRLTSCCRISSPRHAHRAVLVDGNLCDVIKIHELVWHQQRIRIEMEEEIGKTEVEKQGSLRREKEKRQRERILYREMQIRTLRAVLQME